MKTIKKILISFLFLLPSLSYGGSSIFALVPKSIGEHYYPYSTAALGRGGFSMAFMDSVDLNQMNYSSWSYISRTTFTLGMGFQSLSSESEINQTNSNDGNFLGGYIAIPLIQKKLAIGFGILPKSFNDQGFILEDAGVGSPATQTIKTNGSLSEVQFVTSYAVSKNLSVGLLLYYILGNITDNSKLEYSEATYRDVIIENEYHLYGKGASVGLSVFYRLNEKLAFGAQAKLPTKITIYSQQSSVTTNKTVDEYREITFPLNGTVGVTYQAGERWALGTDFDYTAWKKGYLFNSMTVDGVDNNYRLGLGVEYMPSARRIISYSDKINYRGGLYYGKLNFLSNGQPVIDYGLSLGLGLPIVRGSSRLDIAFQLGKRGSLGKNGLSESYFRLNFSIAASELWFLREDR